MVRLNGRTFVTIREAARRLSISTTPLVLAIRRGELRNYGTVGTAFLIDLKEARAWKRKYYSESHAERVRKRWERWKRQKRKARQRK
jgi:excisionase family DNA binding protein